MTRLVSYCSVSGSSCGTEHRAGKALAGNKPCAKGVGQTVAGEVALRAVPGHPNCRPSHGVQSLDRRVVLPQHATRRVDTESTLGMCQGAGDQRAVKGRSQRLAE